MVPKALKCAVFQNSVIAKLVGATKANRIVTFYALIVR